MPLNHSATDKKDDTDRKKGKRRKKKGRGSISDFLTRLKKGCVAGGEGRKDEVTQTACGG